MPDIRSIKRDCVKFTSAFALLAGDAIGAGQISALQLWCALVDGAEAILLVLN